MSSFRVLCACFYVPPNVYVLMVTARDIYSQLSLQSLDLL